MKVWLLVAMFIFADVAIVAAARRRIQKRPETVWQDLFAFRATNAGWSPADISAQVAKMESDGVIAAAIHEYNLVDHEPTWAVHQIARGYTIHHGGQEVYIATCIGELLAILEFNHGPVADKGPWPGWVDRKLLTEQLRAIR